MSEHEFDQEHEHECEHDCCEHDECCKCGGHEHDCDHGHNHGCACGCGGCAHDDEEEESKLSLTLLGVSAVLVVVGLFLKSIPIAQTIVGIIAVVLAAYPLVFKVYGDIKGRRFTEIELMLISVVAACCIGELRDAALVAILYRIGEIIEDRAVENSRKAIDSVAKIQQDYAHLVLPDGTTKKVDAEDVPVGAKINVLPYERFPIDGIVESGISTADASAITGESLPITLGKGIEVKSGMVNGKNSVTVVTTELFGNSTASRIVKMVEDATEKKGNVQKFITRFAKYYTPIVVIIAVALAIIGSIATKDVSSWIQRALVFLVASCPCAIVISIPLGFYTGIGAAAKDGIIVKGSIFIEAFAKAKAFVFDKTGTLTTGNFEVSKITSMSDFSEEQIIPPTRLQRVLSMQHRRLTKNTSAISVRLQAAEQAYCLTAKEFYAAAGACLRRRVSKLPTTRTATFALFLTAKSSARSPSEVRSERALRTWSSICVIKALNTL